MSSSTIRVLLIDDEESDYLMTRALLGQLEDQSPEVEWASTYEDGLRILSERRHDVCLLDYFLEERTGLELLREARSRGSRIPVILLTGKGSREVDLEAMRSGAVDYLVKGEYNPEALERSLRYAVERHRAQEALRASEERHRATFDHLPLGLYRVTEDGGYLEANPHLIRMLDFPERETLRQVHARNYFVAMGDRERFFETLSEHGLVLGFETELRTSEGRRMRVRNTARVHRGPGGTIEYVEGAVEDVSTSHPTQELEARAEAFETLRRATSAGILLVDVDGRVQSANHAACEALGLGEAEAEGRALWDLFHPEDGAAVADALEQIARGEVGRESRDVRLVPEHGGTVRRRVTLAQIPGSWGGRQTVLVLLEPEGGGNDAAGIGADGAAAEG